MIATTEEARKTARWGSYAAFAVTSFTTILVLHKYLSPTGGLYAWLDWWTLIDALLFLCIGIGIWKMSRAAAVSGLILYLTETAWKWDTMGRAGFTAVQILWTVFFLLAFVQGVRGTFAYRGFSKAAS